MANKNQKAVYVKNKKGTFNYELIERVVCGIVLCGTEVKSIRDNQVNLTEGYCFIKNSEIWMKGVRISEFKEGTIFNHEPVRDRKLLLKRKEIDKWAQKLKEKGLTMIPVALFMNDRGLVKVDIALAKGKKLHDKRQSIREREAKVILDRVKKMGR